MNRKIDELGRIVIPKEIRKKYDLSYGSILKITAKKGKIIMEKDFDSNRSECINCQSVIDRNDNFCRYCGEELK